MFNFSTMPALEINQENVRRANDQSTFNAGDHIAKEAQSIYRAGLSEMFGDIESPNAVQEALMQERAEQWRELCQKSFNDDVARRASWVPWTVSGRANYPVAQMNKKADAAMKAAGEWSEKRTRFIENTRKMLRKAVPQSEIIEEYRTGKNREAIASDDPAAAEKIAARLEYLKACHEEGKARNAHWRKHHTMKGYKDWSDEKAARIDAALNSDRAMYHVPYAPYEVSNMNANIKRLEDRLKEINNMKERAAQTPENCSEYDGFTVHYSAADCRINIEFDEKPEENARNILKENSFRWSPREKVWTRKLTGNAEWAARRVISELLKLDAYGELEQGQEPAPQAASPAPLSLDGFAAAYSPEK